MSTGLLSMFPIVRGLFYRDFFLKIYELLFFFFLHNKEIGTLDFCPLWAVNKLRRWPLNTLHLTLHSNKRIHTPKLLTEEKKFSEYGKNVINSIAIYFQLLSSETVSIFIFFSRYTLCHCRAPIAYYNRNDFWLSVNTKVNNKS